MVRVFDYNTLLPKSIEIVIDVAACVELFNGCSREWLPVVPPGLPDFNLFGCPLLEERVEVFLLFLGEVLIGIRHLSIFNGWL